MEDCLSVKFQKSVDGQNIEYTYLGVFDGHGGVHAANFAKENLLDEITKQKGFWSNDETQILKAIKDGFLSTHHKMWKIQGMNFINGIPLNLKYKRGDFAPHMTQFNRM